MPNNPGSQSYNYTSRNHTGRLPPPVDYSTQNHWPQKKAKIGKETSADWSNEPQGIPRSPITGLPPTGFVPQKESTTTPQIPYNPIRGGTQGDQYRTSLNNIMLALQNLSRMRR